MNKQYNLLSLALLSLSLVLPATQAKAQSTLYFGALGTGGSGTWDSGTNGTWNTAVNGDIANITPWINGDVADFAGTAGTVTSTGGMTASGIIFDTAGYTITGSAITLAGPTPTLVMNQNATINASLAGTSGFTVAGTGTLTLGVLPTATGGYSVIGGSTLQFANVGTTGAGTYVSQAIAVGTGSNLVFSNSTSTNESNTSALSGSGNVTISGFGTSYFNLNGTNTESSLTINLTQGSASAASWYVGTVFIGAPTTTPTPNAVNIGTLTVNSGYVEVRQSMTMGGINGTGGAITSDSAASGTILTLNGTGSYTYSGTVGKSANLLGTAIADTARSANVTVNKTGTGTQSIAVGNWTGTTTVSAGTLEVVSANLTGTVTVSGGTLLIDSGTLSGVTSISAGTLELVSGSLTAGSTGLSSGTYVAAGATFNLDSGTAYSGTGAGIKGTVNIGSGGTFYLNNVYGGNVAGSTLGAYLLSTTKFNGAGNLVISGASSTTSGPGYWGFNSTGMINITGTTTINISPAGTSANVGLGIVYANAVNAFSTSSLMDIEAGIFDTRYGQTFAGLTGQAGTYVTNDLTTVAIDTINLASGTQTFQGNIGTASNNGFTVGGNYVGITKTGAGTQILKGTNTYTGATTVSAGALLLNGTGSISASTATVSGVNASNKATYGGAGSIYKTNVGNFGILQVGDANDSTNASRYSLTATGAVTTTSGSALSFILAGTTAGSGYSQLAMGTNLLTIGTGTDLTLTLNYAASVNDAFNIVTGTTAVSGLFASLNGTTTTLADGSTFTLGSDVLRINYGAGGGITLTVLSVPEPSTVVLLGGGALFLAMAIRRRLALERI
ncbi:PEP-CTERM protein-sorting domain-containing protein [Verrucomicrobium sp. GAS474]|uniref:beta strand repeat-containing protein n=1 Tax=Verrucomicrobium sp. GAS474 TaxID=1882831 RepID=UPI000879679F|nr:PEP-CTERM sorting domain-containing protein [Verrucomicrobium sp. GAS474]SDT98627.1 PEP-CTERM protein-sorting domain-containing protein [Verrucomicrobium sp. GAS474]